MTQLVSPSSRHGRSEPDARHANNQYQQSFGHQPLPEFVGDARGRHATPHGQNFERVDRLDPARQPHPRQPV